MRKLVLFASVVLAVALTGCEKKPDRQDAMTSQSRNPPLASPSSTVKPHNAIDEPDPRAPEPKKPEAPK